MGPTLSFIDYIQRCHDALPCDNRSSAYLAHVTAMWHAAFFDHFLQTGNVLTQRHAVEMSAYRAAITKVAGNAASNSAPVIALLP